MTVGLWQWLVLGWDGAPVPADVVQAGAEIGVGIVVVVVGAQPQPHHHCPHPPYLFLWLFCIDACQSNE